ncbi:MAG TPA: DEAD/DEAH box helicase, partial [Firmicutes bacterium]|nr:DEAD/DEAH box helicase [Bacillota bacterium]
MEEYIRNLQIFKEFQNWIDDGERKKLRFFHINETLKTLMISVSDFSRFRNVVIVTFSPSEAEIIFQELRVIYSKPENLVYIPDLNLKDKDNSEEIFNEARVVYELSKILEPHDSTRIFITSVDSFVMPVIPKNIISDSVIDLGTGLEISLDKIQELFSGLGYNYTKQISEPGDFSVRGGIADIFINGSKVPVRLEFFGDKIESIREFDLTEGISIREIEKVRVYPINFRDLLSLMLKKRETAYRDFYLFSYFSLKDTLFITDEAESISKRIDFLRKEFPRGGLLGHVERLEFEFEKYSSRYKNLFLSEHSLSRIDAIDANSIQIGYFARYFHIFFRSLKEWLEEGFTIFIYVNNQWRKEHLSNMIKRYEEIYKESSNIHIRIGLFRKGFLLPKEKIAVITESDIWGGYRLRKEKKVKGAEELDLSSLRYRDFVVHDEYGIGRYKGLQKKDIDGVNSEFLVIEYQFGEVLFVPLERIGLIQKYISVGNIEPNLHSIRSRRWSREKEQAVKSIEVMVKDLLELYAERSLKKGFCFSADDKLQEEFDMEFSFDETEDQVNAIQQVKKDMESDIPMDRLICGDVGFGKTEIAIRAAFKAVKDGKQVAMLAPTTILCEQHYYTFIDRFKNHAVLIEMLSRFVNSKKQREVLSLLSQGKVDIIIGTHRLLSKDISFKDLGLLIIDEEQRFGVKQKEKLRQIKKNVDTLTLTATPIPRTLYFSLLKLR